MKGWEGIRFSMKVGQLETKQENTFWKDGNPVFQNNLFNKCRGTSVTSVLEDHEPPCY